MSHSSHKPAARKRKLDSYKQRFGMSPQEFRTLRKQDPFKALAVKLEAYNRYKTSIKVK